MLKILKQATIRIILQKDPTERSEREIERVIELLQGFEFFSKNKKLSYSEYRELALLMTYKEFSRDSFIYEQGQDAESFYVVLNGSVSEVEKNPKIESWDWAMSAYRALLDWKAKEFDPKAEQKLMLSRIQQKLRADVRQLQNLGQSPRVGTSDLARVAVPLMDAIRVKYYQSG